MKLAVWFLTLFMVNAAVPPADEDLIKVLDRLMIESESLEKKLRDQKLKREDPKPVDENPPPPPRVPKK